MADINYCPKCGKASLHREDRKRFKCTECRFEYYHNVASGVAVIITCGEELLLTVRANNPGKGKLDLPGGFVEPGESLEVAIRREAQEELGLRLGSVRYRFSFANAYEYNGILYQTNDAFFEAKYAQKPTTVAADDVAQTIWKNLWTVALEEFAFDSMKKAMIELRKV